MNNDAILQGKDENEMHLSLHSSTRERKKTQKTNANEDAKNEKAKQTQKNEDAKKTKTHISKNEDAKKKKKR